MSLDIYEVHKDLLDGLAAANRRIEELEEADKILRASLGETMRNLREMREEIEEQRVEILNLRAQLKL